MFKRGEPVVVAALQYAPTLLLCATVLGELLGGFAAGRRESANRSELAQFIGTPRVRVVPTTAATADLYALVYAGLRRKGWPIPTNDLWIAASSLEHGAALLTLDAHFQAVESLRVGARLEDFLP